MLSVATKEVQVDPERREIGQLEQGLVAGKIARTHFDIEDRSGERRSDIVRRQAHVALDDREPLPLPDLIANPDMDGLYRSGETCADTGMTAFDGREQSLHFVCVSNDSAADRGRANANFVRGVFRNGRVVGVFAFLVLFVIAGCGLLPTSAAAEYEGCKKHQKGGTHDPGAHGCLSVRLALLGPTNGSPVRR